MKKIIIIGRNSFIGKNLYFALKKNFLTKKVSYKKFIRLKNSSIKADYIINCSSNKDYVNKVYKIKNDFDYQVALKIESLKTKLLILSSRKVYKPGDAIKETNNLCFSSNYSKNKILTEKKVQKILKNKVLILRISNIIGPRNNYISNKNFKRKVHTTFVDHFFINIKKNLIFNNYNNYKDFISIKKFSEIVSKLIHKDLTGTFNISMGKKVYLKKIINWLNYHNDKDFDYINSPKKYDKDCFYLNNSRLKKMINIKISLKELEKYCKEVSMNFFKKKI